MDKITSKAIIGSFYKTLNQNVGAGWIDQVSNYFTSTQAYEEYAWLGQAPSMRKEVGGRLARKLKETSFTIRNEHYESTLEIHENDLRRDKTGQVMIRVGEQARRANAHWATLLSTLIANANSSLCYDGQYFFDTDHVEGDSGSQSNSIQCDISAYPVGVHGTTTAPSVSECQMAIVKGITQILGFKDDTGEVMNDDANSFMVMTALPLYMTLLQAVATPTQVSESQTVLEAAKRDFSIKVVANPRLTWTESFAVFRTDSALKSFIRQEEGGIRMNVLAEGSDHTFKNFTHLYGIDGWRNVGYGMWQNSCLVTLI